jgi:hypothetical protein
MLYKAEFVEGLDMALEEVAEGKTRPVVTFDDFIS